jgi:hypothetical protein
MYSWIWRHIPFRRWYLKLGTSLALLAGVVALMWYVLFPWAEPLLPFDDVQVTESGRPGGDQVGGPAGAEPTDTPSGDGHDVPYSTADPTSTGIPR